MAQQPQNEEKMDGKNFMVIINQEEKSYNDTELQQFEYFRTFFSKRWQSTENVEKSKKLNPINVGNHIFSLKHLDLLISVCKNNCIDPNLTYQDFVKLVECELYFGSDCLTVDTIVNFLQLCTVILT